MGPHPRLYASKDQVVHIGHLDSCWLTIFCFSGSAVISFLSECVLARCGLFRWQGFSRVRQSPRATQEFLVQREQTQAGSGNIYEGSHDLGSLASSAPSNLSTPVLLQRATVLVAGAQEMKTQLDVETTRADVAESALDEAGEMCRVCMEKPRTVIFNPCSHMACCADCSVRVNGVCPICRGQVTNRTTVFK